MKKKFSPVFLYVSIWRKSKYNMNIRWLSSMFDLSTITSELASAHIKLWFALLSSSIALNCAGWIILTPNRPVLTTSHHTWVIQTINNSPCVNWPHSTMPMLNTVTNDDVRNKPLFFKVSCIIYIYCLCLQRHTHQTSAEIVSAPGWMCTLRVSELSMVCLALVVTCPALPGV